MNSHKLCIAASFDKLDYFIVQIRLFYFYYYIVLMNAILINERI